MPPSPKPNTMNGTAYLSAGLSSSAPLRAVRVKNGRVVAGVGAVASSPGGGAAIGGVYTSAASPAGGLAVFAAGRAGRPAATWHVLSASRQAAAAAVRPVPERDYCSVSPGGSFVAAVCKTSEFETGLCVCRADTWREVWRLAGAYAPVWDAGGTRLLFVRFFDRDGAAAGGRRYWRSGDFPMAFYRQTRAERLRDAHVYAADFGGRPDKPAAVRRLDESEAARIAGGWYPAFLRRCVDHHALAEPEAGQILPAPGGRGVLFWVVRDRRPPPKDPDEVLTHPEPADHEVFLAYIDTRGRQYIHREPDFRPVCWSRDGRRVYGDGGGGRLVRLDARTGRREIVPLPPGPRRLLTFVED